MPIFQNIHLYNHIFLKKAYPEIFEPGTGNLFKDISFLWFEQKIIIKQVTEPYNLKNLYNFHQQKYQLKKALRSGRLEISVSSLNKILNFTPISKQGVYYVWKKGLYLPSPQHFPQLFTNRRNLGVSSKKQSTIMSKLQDMPVFVVRNGFREIPVGISQVKSQQNILQLLYNLYLDYFIWKEDKDIYSLGLFFMNPYDAFEFYNTIIYKYPRSSKELNLSISPVKLNFAYKLNRTSPPRIQFRFVPDFAEISKLLKIYKYQNNIQFHPKQIYGNCYFQGQPIYIIKRKNGDPKQYIFTSKEVLDNTWHHIQQSYVGQKQSIENSITVYNLEDFLCDIEEQDIPSFSLVTNSDAYKYIQEECKDESLTHILELLLKKQVLFINIWAKRIFWALTHIDLPAI